jgi:hypothetical protein
LPAKFPLFAIGHDDGDTDRAPITDIGYAAMTRMVE